MRKMIFAAAALCASPALAQDCQIGKGDILAVESWKLEKVEGIISGIDIIVNVRSNADKAFRMVDANYTFEDALGRRISSFSFDPDLAIAPGEIVETGNGYMGNEMDRALDMRPEGIRVFTCVRSILYEDGAKETFD